VSESSIIADDPARLEALNQRSIATLKRFFS